MAEVLTDQSDVSVRYQVAKVLIVHAGRILLLRRARDIDNDTYRLGKMDAPGGSFEVTEEPDGTQRLETPVEAAIREVEEETGIQLQPDQLKEVPVPEDLRVYNGGRRHVLVHEASEAYPVRLSPAHDLLAWPPAHEAADMLHGPYAFAARQIGHNSLVGFAAQ